jgi:hypothetical protein
MILHAGHRLRTGDRIDAHLDDVGQVLALGRVKVLAVDRDGPCRVR